MATQIDHARREIITKQVHAVADAERIDPELVRERVARGSIAIMQRGSHVTGIGVGLRTKVNVNLGTSPNSVNPGEEMKKAGVAEEYGADTISDQSMGGGIPAIRQAIFACSTLPVTTVPIYQAVAESGLEGLTESAILQTLMDQVEEGVSSCVIHCVTWTMLEKLKRQKRVLGVVSKGGSITSAFMMLNRCNNPFLERFDEVLVICRARDCVLSLGNTARSGCIHDRRDPMQREEIRQNIELACRAHEAGVQVIIEGAGGNIRADLIPRYVCEYKKRSCFPLFVAGPLPTDIAIGYDHIAGCAGASIASAAGADYLCYITPAEHLGLPSPESVREGLIAFRIAAHIGDLVKYGMDAEDLGIARMRYALDRNSQVRASMNPERARELCTGDEECTMCGKFCAIKIMRDL